MFYFNVGCVQRNCAKLENILFTVGKLRNFCLILTAANHRDIRSLYSTINATAQNRCGSNITRGQQICRYLGNTKMSQFKKFHLFDYHIIGFDLDGTLLRYDLNNMTLLVYDLLKNFLVKEKSYPKELLECKFDCDFLQKGLILDIERGNILKLSECGTILKATHGSRFMNEKEICEIYGESRKWDIAIEYIRDPLSAWNGPLAEKLRTLLDYFDIAASLVFAQTVDILDNTSCTNNKFDKNDYKIWPDMLAGLLKIYSREHFATGESPYFESLKKNPEKYLLKTNKKVIELLRQLKASGKALFLLTGSNIDFANFTASYALGAEWRQLFDYTIVFAKKPGFFFAQRQFLRVSNLKEVECSEMSINEDLVPNRAYSQGNWAQLKKSVCKNILNKDPTRVRSLYIGDNLIQDVYTPNVVALMETIALSEEMFENNYEFKKIVQSPLWGSYFSYNGTPTLWSKIIETHSQLCVSHIDMIVKVFVQRKIHCENKEGYFPKLPEGL